MKTVWHWTNIAKVAATVTGISVMVSFVLAKAALSLVALPVVMLICFVIGWAAAMWLLTIWPCYHFEHGAHDA